MVGKYGATWIDHEKQGSVTFSQLSVKKAMKYLL